MSEQTALIRRDDTNLSAEYTTAAFALRETALSTGALIGAVRNPDEQTQAVAAQVEVAKILKLAEESRKAAKEPVIKFGRHIDGQAEDFVRPLKEEQLRLAVLVGDFVKLEEARVRAAELLRRNEERKLQEEQRQAEEAVQAAARAEKQKLDAAAAEAQRKIAEAKNAEQARKAEEMRMEIERQRALSEAKSHEELDKINDAHCRAVAELPVETAVRAKGQRVTEDWDITVFNVWELARMHPNCVKIEARLTEIKALLNLGHKVAGVTATPKVTAGVRLGPERKAIEV
jgi:hypothetical protein